LPCFLRGIDSAKIGAYNYCAKIFKGESFAHLEEAHRTLDGTGID
jgi:hypothetical protein